MSLTISTKTYAADSFGSNVVVYHGPLQTVSANDNVSLKRTAPKPASNNSGVGRTVAKFTKTVTLVGALTPKGSIIAEIHLSIPVGAQTADIDAVVTDIASLTASPSFLTHARSQQINF